MSPFASLMLEDLKLDTVDFVPTYDERENLERFAESGLVLNPARLFPRRQHDTYSTGCVGRRFGRFFNIWFLYRWHIGRLDGLSWCPAATGDERRQRQESDDDQ